MVILVGFCIRKLWCIHNEFFLIKYSKAVSWSRLPCPTHYILCHKSAKTGLNTHERKFGLHTNTKIYE